MKSLAGVSRAYAWGSTSAIQRFLGEGVIGEPLAELWFGAHRAASSQCEGDDATLRACVEADARRLLGEDVKARFGTGLPFLLKLIAPAAPLSIQVHPTRERAVQGFAAENAAGVGIDDPRRSFKDQNHKPEMVYALTEFEAMCGFRAPRRAAELLDGLDAALARRLLGLLRAGGVGHGVAEAFSSLFRDPPAEAEVAELVDACHRRYSVGERPLRVDRTVGEIAAHFPGDPGVVAPLLLNPVTLRPGEALFVPAGAVHGYISGLAVELMASSDNVLRAGLTQKHVDVETMLEIVDFTAAPPIRIAPEVSVDGGVAEFWVPVDDFVLTVARGGGAGGAGEGGAAGWRILRRGGPRIVLGIEGSVAVRVDDDVRALGQGQAVFVGADEGVIEVGGSGRVAVAAVP